MFLWNREHCHAVSCENNSGNFCLSWKEIKFTLIDISWMLCDVGVKYKEEVEQEGSFLEIFQNVIQNQEMLVLFSYFSGCCSTWYYTITGNVWPELSEFVIVDNWSHSNETISASEKEWLKQKLFCLLQCWHLSGISWSVVTQRSLATTYHLTFGHGGGNSPIWDLLVNVSSSRYWELVTGMNLVSEKGPLATS